MRRLLFHFMHSSLVTRPSCHRPVNFPHNVQTYLFALCHRPGRTEPREMMGDYVATLRAIMRVHRTIFVFLVPLLLSSSFAVLSLAQSLSFPCPILLSSLSRIRFSLLLFCCLPLLSSPPLFPVVLLLRCCWHSHKRDHHLNPHKKTKTKTNNIDGA